MLLRERGSRNYTLEKLETKDFKWKNAEGRPGLNPQYAPQRYLMIWLDEEVANKMVELGFDVRQKEDNYNNMGMRPYVKFIIKTGVKFNNMTGEEEFKPKVVMKTPSKTKLLTSESSLSHIDHSVIETAAIAFHSWASDDRRPPSLYLDKLYFSTADSAGTDCEDLDAEYGYDHEEEPDSIDEEVPFI